MPEPLGCLGQFLRPFLGPRDTDVPADAALRSADVPKVMVNNRFVSQAEGAFYRVLREVVGSRGHVLTQVALNRLLFFPGSDRGNPGRSRWRSIVNARSIDFVVADPQTLRPFVAIELDDASHDADDRRVRDDRVDLILTAAGLPLLRIKAAQSYSTRDLADRLAPHLPPR